MMRFTGYKNAAGRMPGEKDRRDSGREVPKGTQPVGRRFRRDAFAECKSAAGHKPEEAGKESGRVIGEETMPDEKKSWRAVSAERKSAAGHKPGGAGKEFGRAVPERTRPGGKRSWRRIPGAALLALVMVMTAAAILRTEFHSEDRLLEASYTDEDVSVTAVYGADAGIPEDAELKAALEMPSADSDQYEEKTAKALAAAGKDTADGAEAAVCSIAFYRDGEEIEPSAPVTVTLRTAKDSHAAGEPVTVVHLGEDGAEVLADTKTGEDGSATFTTESFSDFVVISAGANQEEPSMDEGIMPIAEITEPVARFTFDDGTLNNTGTDDGITAQEVNSGIEKYLDGGVGGEGKAVDFSGNGYIQVNGLKDVDFSKGATISYWSKIRDVKKPDWGYTWGGDQSYPYTGVIQGGIESIQGKIRAEGYNNEENYAVTESGYGDAETWHQITVVYSAYENNTQTMTLYVDGNEKGSKNLNTNINNGLWLRGGYYYNSSVRNLKNRPFYIGYNPHWGNSGEHNIDVIDEFMIYDYALTKDQIDTFFKRDDLPALVWFDGTLGDGAGGYYGSYYPDAQNRLARKDEFEQKGDVWYVRLPEKIGETTLYSYTLSGWYDIYSREYYKPGALVPVEDLGDESTGNHNTVFYADWWAANYDFGKDSTGENKTVLSSDLFTKADTFIQTDVFDYNELYNTRYIQAINKGLNRSTHREQWNDVQKADGNYAEKEERPQHLTFMNWFKNGSNGGQLSYLANRVYGNADHTNSEDAKRGSEEFYLGTITEGMWSQAEELFQPEKSWNTGNPGYRGVNYLGKGKSLYQYDDATGYYYYDSKLNAASYNQSNQRFYVYDKTEMVQNQNSKSDFIPFNDGKNVYEEKNGEVNFWFGFKSTISFDLPDKVGSKTDANLSEKGDHMSFTFSGDDDVWVLVDGQLVLDMGGIHDVVFGNIDFSTGEVLLGDDADPVEKPNYYNENKGTPPRLKGDKVSDKNKNAVKKASDYIKGLEAGPHTLQICYMERGSAQSNCAVYFNLCPSASVEINKVDSENKSVLLPGAKFTLQKENTKEYYHLVESDDTGVSGKTDVLRKEVEWVESSDPMNDPKGLVYETDANGVLKFDLLREGTYILTEVQPPNGYKVYWGTVTITITRKSEGIGFDYTISENADITEMNDTDMTMRLQVQNRPKYLPVKIKKYKEDGKSFLESAQFDLYVKDKDGETAAESGKVLCTLRSDAEGNLVVISSESAGSGEGSGGGDTENTPNGWYTVDGNNVLTGLRAGHTYYLVETQAPEGYWKLPEIEFKVTDAKIELIKPTGADQYEGKVEMTTEQQATDETEGAGETANKEVTVFVFKLTDLKQEVKAAFFKTSSSEAAPEPLEEAEFALYNGDDYNETEHKINDNAEPLWTGISTTKNGKAGWKDKDGNDLPSFLKLSPGTYYLVETKAPEGYMPLDDIIEIVVEPGEEDGKLDVKAYLKKDKGTGSYLQDLLSGDTPPEWLPDKEDQKFVYAFAFKVPNKNAYTLPETGGIGTYRLYMLGSLLLAASGLLLLYKMAAREKGLTDK